jgi:hypothetical protein
VILISSFFLKLWLCNRHIYIYIYRTPGPMCPGPRTQGPRSRTQDPGSQGPRPQCGPNLAASQHWRDAARFWNQMGILWAAFGQKGAQKRATMWDKSRCITTLAWCSEIWAPFGNHLGILWAAFKQKGGQTGTTMWDKSRCITTLAWCSEIWAPRGTYHINIHITFLGHKPHQRCAFALTLLMNKWRIRNVKNVHEN